MKTETYLLPSFWASALINADESDMNDEDIRAMDEWLSENSPGWCTGCSNEASDFTPFHDASNHVLACDCLTYTFDKGN